MIPFVKVSPWIKILLNNLLLYILAFCFPTIGFRYSVIEYDALTRSSRAKVGFGDPTGIGYKLGRNKLPYNETRRSLNVELSRVGSGRVASLLSGQLAKVGDRPSTVTVMPAYAYWLLIGRSC